MCNNIKSLHGLADKIYTEKPSGRPKAGGIAPVRQGERNPIEGKFGQAKVKYGLNRIMARLDLTGKSWVACIIMVLNLVKLAGRSL